MAKTSGHGNPNWTRDETILALSLYFKLDGKVPGPKDARVIELSQLLRGALIHPGAVEANPTFRGPDSVVFKLLNLQHVATGKGLDSTSRTDQLVWEEFGANPAEVHRLATFITAKIAEVGEGAIAEDVIDEVEFLEGGIATREHHVRERSSKLRRQVIARRVKAGGLSCDACHCRSPQVPPGLEDAIYEVHHLIPLAQTGPQQTRIADVAVLCANCHRLLHRLIAHHRRWMGLQEFKAILSGGVV